MTGTAGRAAGPVASAAHAFLAAAHRSGPLPAVRHRGTELSYADVAGLAGGVAARLRRLGVGPGDVVATVLERSVWCPVAALASWAVGAAYAHIDPADPTARIEALLTALAPRAVLVDRVNSSRTGADARPCLVVDDDITTAPYVPFPGARPHDRAYLVFTSGSTGTPKAVQVPHRALLNYAMAFRSRITPLAPAGFGITTTFASDLGNTCVYGALLHGSRLDIYDRNTTLDARAMAAELRAHPVGCLKYTPSLLTALAAGADLAALLPTELLVLGGEALPPRLAEAVLAVRPDLAVYNHYGPSETTIGVLMHRVRGPVTGERVPIGTPLDGVSVRLLDEKGLPVPDGTPGTLHLGGSCLADGYLNDEALTADRFPHGPRGRCYRTDDRVLRNPDGRYEFLGRADRQLKIRGNRIEPAEVEAALHRLPGVRRAVVAGEHPALDAPLELVAYVATDRSREEITGALQDALPPAAVPSAVHVVARIPTTVNGKTDLDALRAAAGAHRQADRADPGDPPLTPVEQTIAEVWCSVLGRPEIGRNQQFVALGGDSFKGLVALGLLRTRFPELATEHLHGRATIAELATRLERRSREEH
ncbi:amino acid adenylation domain-containing protein [Streptomyces sp. NPDC057052]|uniref:non-ribosomal peptide synthetase n=1 Tax=Streptomyces sp. NPDC057052 TaxID=3346010 RepID=UPI00362C9DE7